MLRRPRIEGDREQEILDATAEALVDVGYDRLTMDAVATRARASKASLYRRWSSKPLLVVQALKAVHFAGEPIDTGSLRGDLFAVVWGPRGIARQASVDTMGSIITALAADEEFAAAFRREVLAPKLAEIRQMFDRAKARGEIHVDADVDLIAPAAAGIVLHRRFVLGLPPDDEVVAAVIDQIVIPAAQAAPAAPTTAGHITRKTRP